MGHEVHMSERRSFRSCRRRWNWAYREGYVPQTRSKPLEFGIAYHKAMEAFYDPKHWDCCTPKQKLARAIECFVEASQEQVDTYLKNNDLAKLPYDVEQDYQERTILGTGMLKYHAWYVHPKFDSWFRPVATEIAFAVPIDDPDNPGNPLRCTNSPQCGQTHSNDPNDDDSIVVYAGRVDMLVEDIINGGYFIWDHKTAAQMMKDDGFLQLDDQVGGYPWALSSQLNLDVRGFIYAESRKDFPKPPKLLKKLMGGRCFSTAANQATSLEIFVPYVEEHDPVAYTEGKYDEYIQSLTSNEATQYHQRFTIVKSKAELKSIGQGISLEAADMVDSKLRIYPSVAKFSCGGCAYRQPCLSSFMGEDVDYQLETGYTKTSRRYWMDQEPTSEKS